MAFDLNPVAVSASPILRAIAAGGWDTRSDLARKAGRLPNNITRDLGQLANAGLITGDDLPALTDAGRAQLDAIARAEGGEGIAPDTMPDGIEALRHDEILPDPDNARRDWDSDDAVADLEALAADIRQNGLLQNLVVRPHPDPLDDRFILVGGERRWRAIDRLIQSGDWPADRLIPARRLTTDDIGVRLAALAENLQRRALNPIEEANAYRGLREVGLSTEAIASRVAMTQRHVQARLQLLELTEDQQRRMTLPADDPARLSVSEARKLVANLEAKAKARAKAEAELSPRARLIFAEVRLANPGWYANVPVDAIAMDADPDAVALNQGGYLKIPTTVDLDGVANARIESGSGFDLIITLFGDTGIESNRAYAAALREELGLPQPEEGTWSTPWLNPPFELPADVLADLEVRRAEREKAEDEWQARRDAEAEQVRKRAEAFALTRVHAEATLARAAEAPAAPVVDDAPMIAEQLGRRLPWAATEKGTVLDADGAQIFTFVEMYRSATDREVALAMLAVASVNAAAGLATPPLVVSQPDQAIDGSDPDADEEDDQDEEEGDA